MRFMPFYVFYALLRHDASEGKLPAELTNRPPCAAERFNKPTSPARRRDLINRQALRGGEI